MLLVRAVIKRPSDVLVAKVRGLERKLGTCPPAQALSHACRHKGDEAQFMDKSD